MTQEEAEAALVELSKFYGVPVMPINRYCAALDLWAGAIAERFYEAARRAYPGLRAEYNSEEERTATEAYLRDCEQDKVPWEVMAARRENEAVARVFLMIKKSSLLARMLYGGEPLRTKRCPEHDGKWSGLEWTMRDGSSNVCPHGCQLTGWIP